MRAETKSLAIFEMHKRCIDAKPSVILKMPFNDIININKNRIKEYIKSTSILVPGPEGIESLGIMLNIRLAIVGNTSSKMPWTEVLNLQIS